MIVTSGLNRVRDKLNTDIDIMQLGTGTTAETRLDTGLETALPDTYTPTATTTSQQLVKERAIPSTSSGTDDANGNTVSELVFRNDSNDVDFSHVTFDGVAKTSSIRMDIKTRWFIKEV